MSEPVEPSAPLSLDVVRARIFYLACDVEALSPSAAMLLRAVAESLMEEAGSAATEISEPAKMNGAFEKVLSQLSALRPPELHPRVAVPSSERRLGVVSSQSGYKR